MVSVSVAGATVVKNGTPLMGPHTACLSKQPFFMARWSHKCKSCLVQELLDLTSSSLGLWLASFACKMNPMGSSSGCHFRRSEFGRDNLTKQLLFPPEKKKLQCGHGKLDNASALVCL